MLSDTRREQELLAEARREWARWEAEDAALDQRQRELVEAARSEWRRLSTSPPVLYVSPDGDVIPF